MKKWGAAVATAAIALAALFFGSPYYAVHQLRSSALAGDASALERQVDFPAVREGLKSQLNAALMKQMQSDPEMASNPFSGLGMMLVPAIVESAVDAYVSADGLAALAKGQKPGEVANNGSSQDDSPSTDPDQSSIEYTTSWASLNDFRVSVSDAATGEVTVQLHMTRKGMFDWRLTRVELDQRMFEQNR